MAQWGTESEKPGCPAGGCREEWNLSHPDLVRRVAGSYVAAGADVIATNTFGANCLAPARHGLGEQVEAINKAGAQISRQAAGDTTWVFGFMGPSGKMVVAEEVTENAYKAFFMQARALGSRWGRCDSVRDDGRTGGGTGGCPGSQRRHRAACGCQYDL